MSRYKILIPFVLLLASCQKHHLATTTDAVPQLEMNQKPRIIFVNLEITEDSLTQDKTVVLINSIVSDGKLKAKKEEAAALAPGDIQCSFLSGSGQVLHTIAIPDPFNKTFEYASEDGKLQKKTIKLHKATISLRAPLEPGTAQLLVQQLQDNKQLKDLHTLKLSL